MTELPKPATPAPVSAATERRATIRIDAEPAARTFQGVWLELADGKRFVIDFRARDLWHWFADREVIVTGQCYEPRGEAIGATHFRLDTLRVAVAQPGLGPYVALGPERVMRGELLVESGPTGTKLAGEVTPMFRTGDGAVFPVVGEAPLVDRAGPVVVRARVLEPDMTYTARRSGPDLWITSVHPPDHVDDPAALPPATPCP